MKQENTMKENTTTEKSGINKLYYIFLLLPAISLICEITGNADSAAEIIVNIVFSALASVFMIVFAYCGTYEKKNSSETVFILFACICVYMLSVYFIPFVYSVPVFMSVSLVIAIMASRNIGLYAGSVFTLFEIGVMCVRQDRIENNEIMMVICQLVLIAAACFFYGCLEIISGIIYFLILQVSVLVIFCIFYCKFVFNMENISLIVSEILMIVFLTLFAVIVNFVKLSFGRNENDGAAAGEEVSIKIPEADNASDFALKEPEDVMIMKEPVSSDAAGDYEPVVSEEGVAEDAVAEGVTEDAVAEEGSAEDAVTEEGIAEDAGAYDADAAHKDIHDTPKKKNWNIGTSQTLQKYRTGMPELYRYSKQAARMAGDVAKRLKTDVNLTNMAALIFRAGSVIDEKKFAENTINGLRMEEAPQELIHVLEHMNFKKAEGNLPDSYESLVALLADNIITTFAVLKKEKSRAAEKTGLAMSVIDVRGKKGGYELLGLSVQDIENVKRAFAEAVMKD